MDSFINDILQDRNLQGNSEKWANWMSQLTFTTCKFCAENHGKIVDISILNYKGDVDAHERCKCEYVPMRTKKIGTLTSMRSGGVDSQIFHTHKLPDCYITKKEARQNGWKSWKGNLNEVLPGKMIGGDVYKNRDGKLPSAPRRVWYEADVDYNGGYRSKQRILYSNDGLIFVTNDHCRTFYEMVR